MKIFCVADNVLPYVKGLECPKAKVFGNTGGTAEIFSSLKILGGFFIARNKTIRKEINYGRQDIRSQAKLL